MSQWHLFDHLTELQEEAWRGRPARIHVFLQGSRERAMARLQGMVAAVQEGQIRIRLLGPFHALWYEHDLVVEVMLPNVIARFETRALTDSGRRTTHDLFLPIPDQFDSIQRRRHSRADVVLKVVVTEAESGRKVDGTVVNLSAGGIGMMTTHRFGGGEAVLVDFTTDEDVRYCELPARVVRSQMRGANNIVAIEFTDIHPDVTAALTSYVNRLLLAETNGNWGGKIQMQ